MWNKQFQFEMKTKLRRCSLCIQQKLDLREESNRQDIEMQITEQKHLHTCEARSFDNSLVSKHRSSRMIAMHSRPRKHSCVQSWRVCVFFLYQRKYVARRFKESLFVTRLRLPSGKHGIGRINWISAAKSLNMEQLEPKRRQTETIK